MLKVATVPVLVEAGEHAAATRHADGGGVVVIGEARAVRCELIEMRRDDLLVSIAACGADGMVIGKEKDDVRPGVCGKCCAVEQ